MNSLRTVEPGWTRWVVMMTAFIQIEEFLQRMKDVAMIIRPRVGAPIEMTALVAKTVSWLHSLYEKGLFSYRGIEVLGSPNFHDVTTHPKKEFWSYQQWYRRIKTSFEMNYFIAESPYGWYYKDCSNVHDKPADTQLRPNFVNFKEIFHYRL